MAYDGGSYQIYSIGTNIIPWPGEHSISIASRRGRHSTFMAYGGGAAYFDSIWRGGIIAH